MYGVGWKDTKNRGQKRKEKSGEERKAGDGL